MSQWSRRSFLKAGLAGPASLALAGPARAGREAPHRALRKFRNPAPTLCGMCPARCGLVAFRDGDRVVQITGNVGAPTNRGGLCARAYAGLERVYDPDRVLTPLRRKGPRGSGEWEPVSWREALVEIAERLGRGRSVLHLGMDTFPVEEFRELLGWSEVLVDRRLPGRPGPGSDEALYGSPLLGADLRRCETIYLFGLHPFDGRFSVPGARDLADARVRGARVHLFGAVQGATGSLVEWTPVPPGSEHAVALGVARIILDEAMVAPPFGGLQDSREDLLAALEAYRPEAVAGRTGVTPEQLHRLARAFVRRRPSLALAPPDTAAAVGAALLNHLVGNLNRPGGVQTARGPYFTRPVRTERTPAAWLQALARGGERADLYWVVDANPAYDAPGDGAARALRDPDRVGLLVVMDTHLTETARAADLFLPLATSFECWGLVEGCLPDGRTYLALQQPVTRPDSEPDKLRDPGTEHLALFEPWPRPLGRARGLADVLVQLARRKAAGRMPFRTFWEMLDETLRKSWGPGSFQALMRRGIWVAEEPKAPNPLRPVRLAARIPELPEAEGPALVMARPGTIPRTYANTRWGREIAYEPFAFIHPDTARRHGLVPGGSVRLRTAHGEAVFPVRFLRGLHPDAVAVPDGFGHTAGGGAATATDPALWWKRYGPGDRARALLPPGGEVPVPVEVEPA